jgi:hypothetical protein
MYGVRADLLASLPGASGLEACGLPYAAYRPPLGRLAHNLTMPLSSFHGVSAEDVAAIIARQEDGPLNEDLGRP